MKLRTQIVTRSLNSKQHRTSVKRKAGPELCPRKEGGGIAGQNIENRSVVFMGIEFEWEQGAKGIVMRFGKGGCGRSIRGNQPEDLLSVKEVRLQHNLPKTTHARTVFPFAHTTLSYDHSSGGAARFLNHLPPVPQQILPLNGDWTAFNIP